MTCGTCATRQPSSGREAVVLRRAASYDKDFTELKFRNKKIIKIKSQIKKIKRKYNFEKIKSKK